MAMVLQPNEEFTSAEGLTPAMGGAMGDLSSYQGLAAEWYWKFHVWGGIFYLLTIIAVVSSTIAALRPKSGTFIFRSNSTVWNVLAGTSAVCAAIIGVLNPKEEADRFNAAWIVLAEEVEKEGASLDNITKARNRAERILNPDLFKKSIDTESP